MTKLFISEQSEKHKYEVAGSAEYFNRKSGRIQTIKFDPIIVNGVSVAQAINNAKFKLRKKYNLPIDTKLTIFDYTIDIVDNSNTFEVPVKDEPKCSTCGTRLTDSGECPKCDLLDDRYDESIKLQMQEDHSTTSGSTYYVMDFEMLSMDVYAIGTTEQECIDNAIAAMRHIISIVDSFDTLEEYAAYEGYADIYQLLSEYFGWHKPLTVNGWTIR